MSRAKVSDTVVARLDCYSGLEDNDMPYSSCVKLQSSTSRQDPIDRCFHDAWTGGGEEGEDVVVGDEGAFLDDEFDDDEDLDDIDDDDNDDA